jgi:hypothetical protein
VRQKYAAEIKLQPLAVAPATAGKVTQAGNGTESAQTLLLFGMPVRNSCLSSLIPAVYLHFTAL